MKCRGRVPVYDGRYREGRMRPQDDHETLTLTLSRPRSQAGGQQLHR